MFLIADLENVRILRFSILLLLHTLFLYGLICPLSAYWDRLQIYRTVQCYAIFYCLNVHIQGGAVNRGLKRFFHSIGLYILLRLMFGLKSTGWCGLDPWLTIHSILTSFFLATAERATCFADLYRC